MIYALRILDGKRWRFGYCYLGIGISPASLSFLTMLLGRVRSLPNTLYDGLHTKGGALES